MFPRPADRPRAGALDLWLTRRAIHQSPQPASRPPSLARPRSSLSAWTPGVSSDGQVIERRPAQPYSDLATSTRKGM